MIGRQLDGRYEILERIGEGGMGVVYKARETMVDRMVAIKVLNAQVAQDPQWVQRFNNEARACAKLQHPNTVRLIQFGQAREGLLFMAMEFLDGMSLRSAIDRGGRMRPDRVLRILMQCCQSLGEAHAMGIIHRDIKPDNLYLTNVAGNPDFVKVLDFSVAKLKQQAGSAMQTQAGVVFGTPNYMSPEQGRGLPLDARSDIYALGIVAYEMLMGRPPFTSQNPMEVLAMHVRSPVPPMPGVPDRVAQIVMRSLAKEAAHRQQNVQQLEGECQQALAELGGVPGMMGTGMSGSVPVQQPQMMPAMQNPMAPPPQHQHQPPAQAKTLFADASSIPMPPQQQQQRPAPGGDPAKTMIAGMAPNIPQQQMPQQMPRPSAQMPQQMAPMAQSVPQHTPTGTPGGPDGGSPRTVMLSASEGVVSFAQRGQSVPMPGNLPGQSGTGGTAVPGGGSSVGFWAVCIIIGIAVGVLAYVVVSHVVG